MCAKLLGRREISRSEDNDSRRNQKRKNDKTGSVPKNGKTLTMSIGHSHIERFQKEKIPITAQ